MVLQQYGQQVVWREIFGRVGRMLPALFVALWMLHSKAVRRWKLLRQTFFFVAGVGSGCFLIYSGNMHGYYYVMQQAPPVGTLWVWSVIEMELWFAVVHVAAVLGYMWWNGFGTF
jgi:hypothetical protein